MGRRCRLRPRAQTLDSDRSPGSVPVLLHMSFTCVRSQTSGSGPKVTSVRSGGTGLPWWVGPMPIFKRISLNYELMLLTHVLDGATQLADQRLDGDLSQTTSASIAATLVLARQRLRLLNLVMRDAIDPSLLWCPENDPGPLASTSLGERDRTFIAWSDRKIARRAQSTLNGARVRLRVQKRPE